MAEVRPDEISTILRKQLSGFDSEVDVYDVNNRQNITETKRQVGRKKGLRPSVWVCG